MRKKTEKGRYKRPEKKTKHTERERGIKNAVQVNL